MIISVTCILLSASLGVSVNNVVRFICKGCVPESNECCVGTILSPQYIVTSSYCAEMCQLIEMDKLIFRINKHHLYPYPKTFAIGYNVIGSNTIALVEIDSNLKKDTSFVKLMSVDINLLIGSEATIADVNKHRMCEIKQCEEELSHLIGYYVCAAEKYFEDCYIRQGTPLIINNTLVAIMGIHDTNSCEYSQRNFIAINPMVYWINYMLDSQIYDQTKQVLFSLNYRRVKSNKNPQATKKISNTVKGKIKHKNNNVSYKGKNKPYQKMTSLNKKNKIKALKKYTIHTTPRKNISKKNNMQRKKNKTSLLTTKKSTKISKVIIKRKNTTRKMSTKKVIIKRKITTRKITTRKMTTRKHTTLSMMRGIKVKSPTKRFKKQKDCSRLTSVLNTNTKILRNKMSTNKPSKRTTRIRKTTGFSSTTKSFTYKTKNKTSYKPKTTKRNIKKKYSKNISPTTKIKYPAKISVKQSNKGTTVTKVIKNKENSIRLSTTTLILTNVSLDSNKTRNDSSTTVTINMNSTNVLDWFKSALKNISNDPKPFLVLNTTTVPTVFIDLT